MKANIPPVGREPNKGLQLHLIRFIVQWDYHGFVFVTTDDVQRKIRLFIKDLGDWKVGLFGHDSYSRLHNLGIT